MIIYVPSTKEDPFDIESEENPIEKQNKLRFYEKMTAIWNRHPTVKTPHQLIQQLHIEGGKRDTCIVVWGRFQPPHKGHGKLFDTAIVLGDAEYKEEILKNKPGHTQFGSLTPQDDERLRNYLTTPEAAFLRDKDADVFIMPTNTCEDKGSECRYPLNLLQKLTLLDTIYPDPKYRFTYLNMNNIKDVISMFHHTYKYMVIVCGRDSISTYTRILTSIYTSGRGVVHAPAGEDRFRINIKGSRVDEQSEELSASVIRRALQLCLDNIVKQGMIPDNRTDEYTDIEKYKREVNDLLVTEIITKYEKKHIRDANCANTDKASLEDALIDYIRYLEEQERGKGKIKESSRSKRKGPSNPITAEEGTSSTTGIREEPFGLRRSARLKKGGEDNGRFMFMKRFMRKLLKVYT